MNVSFLSHLLNHTTFLETYTLKRAAGMQHFSMKLLYFDKLKTHSHTAKSLATLAANRVTVLLHMCAQQNTASA